MRKIILSVISTLVVTGLILGSFLVYIRGRGFSAREEPTWMERVMAQNARKIATPSDAKNLSNPRTQQTADMISEADEHFVEHCGICHGIDGRGDTVIGRNLYPRVPDSVADDVIDFAIGAGLGTAVLEKRGQDWRIVHWHSSAPRRAPAPAASPTPRP